MSMLKIADPMGQGVHSFHRITRKHTELIATVFCLFSVIQCDSVAFFNLSGLIARKLLRMNIKWLCGLQAARK
jgi:hypothetical protein